MPETSAALKPSSSFSNLPPLPALVPVEMKGRSIPQAETPPAHAAPTGRTVQGRDVVVGVTAPHHRVASRNLLAVTTPLMALAGMAGMYAWASGVDEGNYDDAQAYGLHWRNGLIGAAGLLTGAVPAFIAWGRHAYQCRREAAYLRQPENAAPGNQLSTLLEHAMAERPLTLAGVHKCLQRIETLRGPVPAQDCALGIARLGRVVPVEAGGCGPAPLAIFNALVDQLARMHRANMISLPEFREALFSLAQHLRVPHGGDERQAQAMARSLLGAYADATSKPLGAGPDMKSSGPARSEDEALWNKADLIVDLCGTNYFAPHAQDVQLAGSDLLHCNPSTYHEARPMPSQRLARDDKAPPAAAGPELRRLIQAPAYRLKDEVGRAIHLAMHKDLPAVDQGWRLLTILHAIASRTDLPQGAFLEGLLAPGIVADLARAVAIDRSPVPEGLNRAALIAELPRLSQLQGSPDLLHAVIKALGQLPQHAHEGQDRQEQEERLRALSHWIDVACIAANARITGTGQSASLPVGGADWRRTLDTHVANLNQPWVAAIREEARDRARPGRDAVPDASDVVIQVNRMGKQAGADDS